MDTQHDCDSGSDSEWVNGDEIDFERNAFDAFDDNRICNFVLKLLFH